MRQHDTRSDMIANDTTIYVIWLPMIQQIMWYDCQWFNRLCDMIANDTTDYVIWLPMKQHVFFCIININSFQIKICTLHVQIKVLSQ